MTAKAYSPDEQLKSRVESFLIARNDKDMVRTLPPNTAPVLVFRFQGIIAEQFPGE